MTTKRRTQPISVDPERHARKCAICQSEDRAEIEELFLHWISVGYIASMYSEIPNRMTIHRHVYATGLYEFRRRNLRSALDRLVENADTCKVTGDCVLRAIRAHSRLSEDGRWREPVQRMIVSRSTESFVLPKFDPEDLLEREILIDTPKRLEIPVTSTKQISGVVSNREKIDPSTDAS